MLQFSSESSAAAAEYIPLRSCAINRQRDDKHVDKRVSGNEKKGRAQRVHMESAKKFIEGRGGRYLKG